MSRNILYALSVPLYLACCVFSATNAYSQAGDNRIVAVVGGVSGGGQAALAVTPSGHIYYLPFSGYGPWGPWQSLGNVGQPSGDPIVAMAGNFLDSAHGWFVIAATASGQTYRIYQGSGTGPWELVGNVGVAGGNPIVAMAGSFEVSRGFCVVALTSSGQVYQCPAGGSGTWTPKGDLLGSATPVLPQTWGELKRQYESNTSK